MYKWKDDEIITRTLLGGSLKGKDTSFNVQTVEYTPPDKDETGLEKPSFTILSIPSHSSGVYHKEQTCSLEQVTLNYGLQLYDIQNSQPIGTQHLMSWLISFSITKQD